VPGAAFLVHKMLEAKYRHHQALQTAARKHSGLPPISGFLSRASQPPHALGPEAADAPLLALDSGAKVEALPVTEEQLLQIRSTDE